MRKTLVNVALVALCSAVALPAAAKEIKAKKVTAPAKKATTKASAATGEVADRDKLWITVGAKVGGTFPPGWSPTYFLAIDASYRFPFLDRLLGAGIELSLGAPGSSGTVNSPQIGGATDYDLSMTTFGLTFQALAAKSFGDFTPYGGLGWSIFVLSSTMEAFGVETTESQARSGVVLKAGCGYRLGPGEVVGELRYHFVGVNFLSSGRSDIQGITLSAGYQYTF